MTLLDKLYGTPWAIRPESLECLIALAERRDVDPDWVRSRMHHQRTNGTDEVVVTTDGEIEPPFFGAVSAVPGTPIEGARLAYRRGSVGVVPVIGPIVRYGSMFNAMSGGATSVGAIALDLNLALADPDVAAILLHVDSPGGETNGISELGDMIYDARSKKRIVAYVSDLGASAGYWLASAAHEIVVAETAALGSIGVVAAVRDPSRADDGQIEFVSQVSPLKRVDPRTKDGKAQIQGLVDTLAGVFVRTVARNRDVDPEAVVDDFGRGGLLVGQDAVDAGLADRLGSFESTLRDLAAASAIPTPGPAHRPAAASDTQIRGVGDPDDADAIAGVVATRAAAAVADAIGATSQREEPVDLIASIRALLDQDDGTRVVNDLVPQAAPEGSIVNQNQTPPPAPPAPPAPTAGPTAENDALRVRLAAAESENQRLRLDGITAMAKHYVQGILAEGRALPAEESALVALHIRAAIDDMYQPVQDGPTRTKLVEASIAARQPRGDLIKEMMEPATLRALADRAAAPRQSAEGQLPSEERERELLGMTGLGRKALASANGTNGTGAH